MATTSHHLQQFEAIKKNLVSDKNSVSPDLIESFLVELSNDKTALARTAPTLDPQTFLSMGNALCGSGRNKTSPARREALEALLDIMRSPFLLQQVGQAGLQDAWFRLSLAAIQACDFTVGKLFRQRVAQYGQRPLFTEIKGIRVSKCSWAQTSGRVNAIANALLELQHVHKKKLRVAMYSQNSLDLACFDIACLTSGIVNVPLPTNATPANLSFILQHSKCNMVFVSGDAHLAQVTSLRTSMAHPGLIIAAGTSKNKTDVESFITLTELVKMGSSASTAEFMAATNQIKINDLATIMYTSGTTELPKGIKFSHLNLVSKRFARAIALPEIGDKDRFLCYLPLFHTFGRYFEMLGTIFWGATYAFMENPKLETLLACMRLVHPTIFISIPKKWIQLYEHIAEKNNLERQPAAHIKQSVKEATGGKLRWGLSAAGYLDPDIFMFFQENGIGIMSGFGMTEAAGGITMTPPWHYKPNSVGLTLPGIEVELEADGEMRIRGPYVMTGYLDQTHSGLGDGWFHTGDIFIKDSEGHFQIVDRKKEIYKNVRGETISPQKIENMFHDFDSIKRAFLVGDHREFNTLLLFPNYDYDEVDLSSLTPVELRDFFSSLLVPVNQFLAPYERIVNFEIIDRDFDAGVGELTVKGTYKRKQIEKHFSPLIAKLYEAEHVPCNISGFEVRIPTWFLREIGLTRHDIKPLKSGIALSPTGAKLSVRARGSAPCCQVKVGNFTYAISERFLDFGDLIRDPALWLGNLELQRFVGDLLFARYDGKTVEDGSVQMVANRRQGNPDKGTEQELAGMIESQDRSAYGIHLAARVLNTTSGKMAVAAIEYLESVIRDRNEMTLNLAKTALMRVAGSHQTMLKKRAFQVLILNENRDQFKPVFERFLANRPAVLDSETVSKISEQDLSEGQLDSIILYLNSLQGKEVTPGESGNRKQTIIALLRLLAEYGIRHPLSYKSLRVHLVRWAIFGEHPTIVREATTCSNRLRDGFRQWLGTHFQITIDPESMSEFRWRDVLAFEDTVPPGHRNRIAEAIQNFPLIREAVFLFSGGKLIQLQDIPPTGIWVSFLGALHGKSVYRATIQTHLHGAFDVAINVNTALSKREMLDEMHWLISFCTTDSRRPLVENFGGYWPDYDLWTEEFIPGDTVEKYLRRLERQTSNDRRGVEQLWPSFAWSGISAYIDFWNRTGRRQVIADPTPANVIVPTHDFQIGFRIVSLSQREAYDGLVPMLYSFYENFISSVEAQHEKLQGTCGWDIIFSAFLEILGEKEGLRLLQETLPALRRRARNKRFKAGAQALTTFVGEVEEKGFRSQRLHFAIQRYWRWHTLNPGATAQACIQTVLELETSYTLAQTEIEYPGSRIQFFRDTLFAKSDVDFRRHLNAIIRKVKRDPLATEDLVEEFTGLREKHSLSESEEIYLTRLTYPHLGVSDSAEFVSFASQGAARTALVVFIEDDEGYPFAIRGPASPKEIGKLHQLFTAANLPVDLRPDHQFLLVLTEKNQVVGGLFYRPVNASHVHLEKVVVDSHYRHKGISDGLLNEFFNRLRTQRIKLVTVGFLRPQYFYKFGFKIDHRYGNMIKKLKPHPKTGRAEAVQDRIQ